MQDPLQSLLQRTSLTLPFPEFLKVVQTEFPDLGDITGYEAISEGYESANFHLRSANGRFVLKIFESDREKANIDALLKILLEAPVANLPVPELLPGQNGYLGVYMDSGKAVYYYITYLFEGTNFENKTPSLREIQEVTTLLSNLNTLNFPVVEAYDSWGNKNLVKEFDANKNVLSEEVTNIVEPIVEDVRRLSLEGFQKAVIHGDMQRKHVLKNAEGSYCIIDFGCMSNDYKVYEVSTFLAWFCLTEATNEMKQEIMKIILETYNAKHALSDNEIASLPVLIKASYAAYYMKTSMLIAEGDTSEETKNWHTISRRLLS